MFQTQSTLKLGEFQWKIAPLYMVQFKWGPLGNLFTKSLAPHSLGNMDMQVTWVHSRSLELKKRDKIYIKKYQIIGGYCQFGTLLYLMSSDFLFLMFEVKYY